MSDPVPSDPSGAEPRVCYGIVGTGAVAGAVAVRLVLAGRAVRLYGRDRIAAWRVAVHVAEQVADRLAGTDWRGSIEAVSTLGEVLDVDVLVLAVSDAALGSVAHELARVPLPRGREAPTVLHTSGALDIGVLAPLAAVGYGVAGVHPLAALPPQGDGAPLATAWYALQGEGAALTAARACVAALRGSVGRVRPRPADVACAAGGDVGGARPRAAGGELLLGDGPDAKLRYHAAASLVSGGVVVLLALAEDELRAAGVAPATARAALGALARSALENTAALGPAAALTGPAARGDVALVTRQLAALDPRAAALYQRLLPALAALAVAGGRGIDPAPLQALADAAPPRLDPVATWRRPPCVVVSVLAPDVSALAARARAAALGEAVAFVELRLDALADWRALADDAGEPTSRLVDLVASLSSGRRDGRPAVPVLVTVRPTGSGTADARAAKDADRLRVLRAAAFAGAAAIDLDERLADEAARAGVSFPPGVVRVWSRHVAREGWRGGASHAGPAAALDRLAAPLFEAARPGDVVKLVAEALDANDTLDVLAWASARWAQRGAGTGEPEVRLAVFCSGAALASLASRLLAPVYGCELVYAAADDPNVPLAAPGQPRLADLLELWPPAGPVLGTRLFGIVGRPLGHSASPRVHAALHRDLDALLVPLETQTLETQTLEIQTLEIQTPETQTPETAMLLPTPLAALLPRLAGPSWRGLSVTAPCKGEALRYAAGADAEARAIGAANTLVRCADGGWHAANTDAPAVLASLGGAAAVVGRRAVVVGAGGAARAAAHALSNAGAEVTIAARNPAAAEGLAAEVGGAVCPLPNVTGADPGEGRDGGAPPFEVVVHTTPLGTDGRGLAPVPEAWLGPGVVVLDAVYRPERTGLVRRAEAVGARAVPGTRWFLAQAEAQARRFHGLSAGLGGGAAAALERHLGAGRAEWVVLIGLRGAGKTTVGRALAAELGAPFVDLDERLAAAFVPEGPVDRERGGRSAGELLAALGEPRFRALERAALVDVLAGGERGLVLATGGGAVTDAGCRALLAGLAGSGWVVWLNVAVPVLVERLRASGDVRPPLTGKSLEEEVAHLASRRERMYRALADIVVETPVGSGVGVEAVVTRIVQELRSRARRATPDTAGGQVMA